MEKLENRLSVVLPPALREYVQRVAERELIAESAVVRRLVADAARTEQAALASGREAA
jgi:hypothetical protein